MVERVGNILNAAQYARLTAISKTARQLDDAFLRLNSGFDVNSALDNPTSFFLARALRNRAGDLTRLLDGIGQSIRTIETADHGVKAQLKLLDQAESYLEDILEKYRAGQLSAGNGLAPNETLVTFNSSADFITYVVGQDVPASGTITTSGNDQVTFSGNFWKRLAFNYTITPDTVITFEYSSNVEPDISAIGFDNDGDFNNDSNRFYLYGTQLGGVTYAAPIPTYAYTGAGAIQEIEIPVGTYFTGAFSHLAFIHDDDPLPYGNATYNRIILREGVKQDAVDFAPFNEGYTKILENIDAVTIDAHYRGVNLLRGENLITYFNETRSHKLMSEGMDATAAGLGLNADGFTTITQIEAELEKVRLARNNVRRFGTTLSNDLNIIKVRETFSRESVNVHKAGADDLTLNDPNEEGAKILALQTRRQIQMSILALRPPNVLDILA